MEELDLRHYASKYYDPVKAREYYLRTRELKGRSGPTEKLSAESRQKQGEGRLYVTDQVRTKLTAEREAAASKHKERLEKLQKSAEETRDRIVEKLEAFIEQLKADLKGTVPDLKLNEIPPTATPRQKAFLEKQNARLLNEHTSKTRKATAKANKTAQEASAGARKAIQEVGKQLREALSDARTEYSTASKTVTARYQSDLKTELQNINDKVR